MNFFRKYFSINKKIATFMFEVDFTFPLLNYAFNIANREDLIDEEEDLVEEVDLCFLCFCFLGILGMSVCGISVNMSEAVCRPSLSPKSVQFIQIKEERSFNFLGTIWDKFNIS